MFSFVRDKYEMNLGNEFKGCNFRMIKPVKDKERWYGNKLEKLGST